MHNIELLTSYVSMTGHAATYCKSMDNFVFVNLSVKHESGIIGAGLHTVAVLPMGFRPRVGIITSVGTDSGRGRYVGIYPDGSIKINLSENVVFAHMAVAFPSA